MGLRRVPASAGVETTQYCDAAIRPRVGVVRFIVASTALIALLPSLGRERRDRVTRFVTPLQTCGPDCAPLHPGHERAMPAGGCVSRMRIGKAVAFGERGEDRVLVGDEGPSLVVAGLVRR